MQQASTILIVDDMLSAREVLRGLLTGLGYNLAFAANGQEALEQAAALTPDLILLDVMMPDMDGFEVCRRLRADPHLAEVPIIMVTALDDHESRLQGIEAGADDFISKPYNHVELQARVKTITRLNRYRRLMIERDQRQRAEDEVYRRNQELTLLNYVIITAASTLNVEDALYVACEALAQALEFKRATAILLNSDQTQFSAFVEYAAPELNLNPADLNEHHQETLNDTIPVVGLLSEYLPDYETALAIVDEQVLDPALSPLYHLMRDYGYRAMVLVPILMGDQVAGIIELKSVERRSVGKQDLTLAQSVATSVGQTIETISLYQNLQSNVDHLNQTVAHLAHELNVERHFKYKVLEAVDNALFITNNEGVIEYINPAGATHTGFSPADAVGQRWQIFQFSKTDTPPPGEASNDLFNEITEQLQTNHSWQGELYHTLKNGSRQKTVLTVLPLVDPETPGQIRGLINVQRNSAESA